jgi:hypothetical protein
MGRYVIRAAVEGAPSVESSFYVKPMAPGSVSVSETLFNGWPQGRIETLIHTPGTRQTLYIQVSLLGVLPQSGKTLNVGLFYQGRALFNAPYLINENKRTFFLPYQDDFVEGVYTALLSANGEPPAQYVFRVQHPVIESPEAKNRRIQAYFNAVMPGSSQPSNQAATSATQAQSSTESPSRTDCYSGNWHENDESNGFTWSFGRMWKTLRIRRNDNYVWGTFQPAENGWYTGTLYWRNGDRWDGVNLRVNEACNEIETNQHWSYKR